MRKINKFTIFNKLTFRLKKFPLRLLKLKRTKWLRLQKVLKFQNKRQSKRFINLFAIKNSNKIWEKSRRSFKKGIVYKNFLYTLFEKTIRFKKLKSKVKNFVLKKDFIHAYLIHSMFRVDILLFNLNFFESIIKAKQYLNNNIILLNNKPVQSNVFLKKGDVLAFKATYSSEFFLLKSVLIKFSSHEKILTFVEVDFYTMTIVILKNSTELSNSDLYLLYSEYFNIKTFSYNFI